MQTNTNNVNKTRGFLQTTGGKDKLNSLYAESITNITTQNSERKLYTNVKGMPKPLTSLVKEIYSIVTIL